MSESEMTWELLTVIEGRLNADGLAAFLQAEGIPVELIQEGAGLSLYPVTFGPLGEVQVFVPKENAAEAQTLLAEFNKGIDFEAEGEAEDIEENEENPENEA